MVKPIAEQPSRSASETEPVTAWSFSVARLLLLLSFRMVGIAPAKVLAPGLDHAERGGVGGEAGGERKTEMVVRVVGGRVGGEGAGGAVLEALVHRQDHQLAGAAELALHEDAGEVGLGARVVALVVVEDRLDLRRDLHRMSPGVRWPALSRCRAKRQCGARRRARPGRAPAGGARSTVAPARRARSATPSQAGQGSRTRPRQPIESASRARPGASAQSSTSGPSKPAAAITAPPPAASGARVRRPAPTAGSPGGPAPGRAARVQLRG